MKKTIIFRLFLAVLAVLALHSRAVAEDIDLYVNGGGSGSANVLIYLDNSSNWSTASQAWSYSSVYANCDKYKDAAKTTCQGYVNQIYECSAAAPCGSKTTLLQGQVEVRALQLVLNQIACSQPKDKQLNINVGLMMHNTAGTVDSPSGMSGYIRHAITPLMTQCDEKTDPTKSILLDLDNIDKKITTPDFKGPSSAEYGAGLFEAFKYFGGYSRPDLMKSGSGGTAGSPVGATGFGPTRYGTATPLEDGNAFTDSSKTKYKSPITGADSCGKNFIILIGNGLPNQEYGTDTGASPNPTNKLMTRIGYNPGAQIYPVPLPNSQKSMVRFADEWSKFLYDTDVSEIDGQQNVQTFTIDVYNAKQDTDQSTLLQSMAAAGRGQSAGGYFPVGGDLQALIDALKETFLQIASVNSVFASASLPVSVNAQGTFLNQVFMGVFRPDGNAMQRWAGNMKQYQFTLDPTTGAMSLSDANKKPAVDPSSGFITDCSASFWTHDSGTYWQSVTKTQSGCGKDSTYGAYSKFSDIPDGPMVERGASAQMLRDLGHTKRNISTCTDSSCTSIVDFNATKITIPSTGLSQGTTSTSLVNWARGQNVGDGNNEYDKAGNLITTTYPDSTNTSPATRPTVHGEVVHSRPLAVNYGSGSVNDVVVFYGAGDGMLHAVNGNQSGAGAGNELWAFIAPEHWGGTDSTGGWNLLDRVHSNSPLIKYPGVSIAGAAPKTYFFDGSIGGYQEFNAGALTKLYIYPTMRRGGTAVYAFNATNKPGTGSSQPTLMWKFSNADNANMGQSWSTPVAFRVKLGTGNSTLVTFGAGYDKCEDDAAIACSSGRGVFVMDAATGKAATANFRFFDPGSTGGRFVADIAPVDVNGDGFVDLLYAVDTRGNIWRINTSDPSKGFAGYTKVADWPMNLIATVGDWTTASEQRKFMYAPSVVMLGTQASILVGTGDREQPLDSGSAASVNNRFYGIRDDITKTGVTTDPATGVKTGANPTVVIGYGTDAALASANQLTNATGSKGINPTSLASGGWYINLSSTGKPFEQVVTAPLTIGGRTHFSTFQPKASSSTTCSFGTGRTYAVDFQTGVMAPNSTGAMEPDIFKSQGIPPSPVGGLVSIDGKVVPFCIGCTGPTVLSPNRITPKVKPDRKPVYRYQRIDS